MNYAFANPAEYSEAEEEDLIQIGAELFLRAVEEEFVSGSRHVVPLSGGLDSRAILGALIQMTPADQISTYTFGTPGTLDFEIGKRVAQALGTRHTPVPLTSHSYTLEEMVNTARRMHNQTFLFHHPPLGLIDEIAGDGQIWSGYIGDVIVGGHTPLEPAGTERQAKQDYLKKARFVRSINIGRGDTNEFVGHLSTIGAPSTTLSFEEQLLFEERTAKLTAPHVLYEGPKFATPFINNEWMSFMLGLPPVYRRQASLFKKILLRRFPNLFALPTKTAYGLPLGSSAWKQQGVRATRGLARRLGVYKHFPARLPDPGINYLDFNWAIRHKKDFAQLIRENVMDLHTRRLTPWIDIPKLLKLHMEGAGNLSDALIVLASLEIHLKSYNS